MNSVVKSIFVFVFWLHPFAASAQDALHEGDSAYCAFNYDLAIAKYAEVARTAPSADAYLKLADAYLQRGDALDVNSHRDSLYTKAELTTRYALQFDDNNAAAWALLAQATGKIALVRGASDKVTLGNKVKEYAEKALALNPNNARANAVLGVWNYEVTNLSFFERMLAKTFLDALPDASFETSEKFLAKAVAQDDDVIYYRLAYAKTLIKLDKDQAAKTQLEAAINLPLQVAYDEKLKATAKKLLQQF
jgi:hypothetical protein